MSACDMCGKEAELVNAKIEGTELELCPRCAKFGEVIKKPAPIHTKRIPGRPAMHTQLPRRKEIIQMIVSDYAQKIRRAREKRGLKQEEFAKFLNEKASIMQKMESGQFKPSIETAQKLGKKLDIELVETLDEGGDIPLAEEGNTSKSGGFTMADFVKDKRKKN